MAPFYSLLDLAGNLCYKLTGVTRILYYREIFLLFSIYYLEIPLYLQKNIKSPICSILSTHWRNFDMTDKIKKKSTLGDQNDHLSLYLNERVWYYIATIFSFKALVIGTRTRTAVAVLVPVVLWPQWWSFADVSQQGLDFSKQISKRKTIFWFDFHRCSHGSSKSA